MSARPKVLTVGLLTPVETLDLRVPHHDSVLILKQILETPFGLVPGTTDVVPQLFDGPLEEAAGAALPTYRARLRPGILFSDGTPLTAAHVARSLRATPLVSDQAEVTAEDDQVVLVLRRPNRRFDIQLTHNQCAVSRTAGSTLTGTGPYRLAARDPGVVRLEKNPHFRRDVAIDEVVFRTYPLDAEGRPTALAQALETGEVDLSIVLPRDAAGRLAGVRKSIRPGVSTAVVFLNTESPALHDVRLRRIIALSVNRQEFASEFFANPLAFVATSLLPPGLAPADDGLGFDPGRAQALLAEPGVRMPARLSLVLTWAPRPYLPNPERAAAILATQLAPLGVALDVVRTSSITDYYDKMIEGQYDLVLGGWSADTPDPSDFLETLLASDRVPSFGNQAVAANGGRLRCPELDQAMAEYRAERTAAHLDAIMRLVREQVPLVSLIHGSTCTVSSFRVANLKPSPLAFLDFSVLDLEG